MKRSIILFVSLFMAASMITSCAKDAMESLKWMELLSLQLVLMGINLRL